METRLLWSSLCENEVIRVGPDSSVTGTAIKRGKFEDKHPRRIPCEDEGRNGGD